MRRRILAILAGILTIGVLSVGGDAVMRHFAAGAFDASGFSDRVPVLLAMIAYTTVFSALGGWVTAAVARRTDLREVWILAGLQFVMTLIANTVLFDRRLLWFYGVGVVLASGAIVVGGRIRVRRSAFGAAV
jgi:hypothetical protein